LHFLDILKDQEAVTLIQHVNADKDKGAAERALVVGKIGLDDQIRDLSTRVKDLRTKIAEHGLDHGHNMSLSAPPQELRKRKNSAFLRRTMECSQGWHLYLRARNGMA
jgi:hypothetical protein